MVFVCDHTGASSARKALGRVDPVTPLGTGALPPPPGRCCLVKQCNRENAMEKMQQAITAEQSMDQIRANSTQL